MARTERWAIGQVVFSGREQLAVVRALDGLLVMSMLNYPAEMREPADIKQLADAARVTPRKLKLATELVSHWQAKRFDLGEYQDRYQRRLKQAIEAKLHGEELPTPDEEEPEVINLMDALQKSVAAKTADRRGSLRIRRPAQRTKASRRRRA
jgi:DNA end-binding protein Ku